MKAMRISHPNGSRTGGRGSAGVAPGFITPAWQEVSAAGHRRAERRRRPRFISCNLCHHGKNARSVLTAGLRIWVPSEGWMEAAGVGVGAGTAC